MTKFPFLRRYFREAMKPKLWLDNADGGQGKKQTEAPEVVMAGRLYKYGYITELMQTRWFVLRDDVFL